MLSSSYIFFFCINKNCVVAVMWVENHDFNLHQIRVNSYKFLNLFQIAQVHQVLWISASPTSPILNCYFSYFIYLYCWIHKGCLKLELSRNKWNKFVNSPKKFPKMLMHGMLRVRILLQTVVCSQAFFFFFASKTATSPLKVEDNSRSIKLPGTKSLQKEIFHKQKPNYDTP